MGASPNARPKLELVIVLMLEAVTLFVSSSLFPLVATTLLVLITVYVGVLLLMSSMVTPVSGDTMSETVMFRGCWRIAIQARPAPSPRSAGRNGMREAPWLGLGVTKNCFLEGVGRILDNLLGPGPPELGPG